MSATPVQMAARPEMLRSKSFWTSLMYFSKGFPLVERDRLTRSCPDDIGRHIDYRFRNLPLRDRLHACPICRGLRFSAHVPYNLEYAK